MYDYLYSSYELNEGILAHSNLLAYGATYYNYKGLNLFNSYVSLQVL